MREPEPSENVHVDLESHTKNGALSNAKKPGRKCETPQHHETRHYAES